MPSAILLIDCDNQPAARTVELIESVQNQVGRIGCVFLAGNSRGRHVKEWVLAVANKLPDAVIDSVIVENRKQAADAHLIMKMAYLRALFAPGSTQFVVVTADNQILAAAEILSAGGHKVFVASVNMQQQPTKLPRIKFGALNTPKRAPIATLSVTPVPATRSASVKQKKGGHPPCQVSFA